MEQRVSKVGNPGWPTGLRTYKEDNSDVQHEGDHGIQYQGDKADAVNVTHGHAGHFDEEGDDTINQGACRRVIVKGHEGVHLELGRAQHALNHDETEGFENDTAALVYIA